MLRLTGNNFKEHTMEIACYVQPEFENDTLTLDVYDMVFGTIVSVKLCVEMVMIEVGLLEEIAVATMIDSYYILWINMRNKGKIQKKTPNIDLKFISLNSMSRD